MSNDRLTAYQLSQFTGSEHWYRHGLVRDILYTDGAKYVADEGGAYWLLDEIAFALRGRKQVAAEEFQVWRLRVKPDRTAALACEDGNGRTVFEKALDYTDFPADSVELWFENNTIYFAERALIGGGEPPAAAPFVKRNQETKGRKPCRPTPSISAPMPITRSST